MPEAKGLNNGCGCRRREGSPAFDKQQAVVAAEFRTDSRVLTVGGVCARSSR
jgi:hypothetical protein